MLSYRKISDNIYLSADVSILYNDENLDRIKLISTILLIFWIFTLPTIIVFIYFTRNSQNLM
jgi:hypothetical protein